MTVITEEGGRQNMFAKEPEMWIDKTEAERYGYVTHAERAETQNGRWAMIGIVSGLLSYTLTGNFFFGMY